MAVKPIPEEWHSVTPSLTVQGAAKLIDFLKQGFGAEQILGNADARRLDRTLRGANR